MYLKPPYDLEPQELLRLESPFFAAEKLRELFRRGTPIPASLFFHYTPPMEHRQPDIHYQDLISAVEAGAAAARHAVNAVLKGEYDELAEIMKAKGLAWPHQNHSL